LYINLILLKKRIRNW